MKTIVYAKTVTLASRGYKPSAGEVVAYRSFDEFERPEDGFDNVKVIGRYPSILKEYKDKDKPKKKKKK